VRPPFPPDVLEVADQLLLLGIHRNHRLMLCQGFGHALIDMRELRIAVRMVAALADLAVGLQTELPLRQQFSHHRMAHGIALRTQFRGQTALAFAGPA